MPQSGTEFVGRTAELTLLQRRFDAAGQGRGSVTIVIGEPGVGKTALAGHFGSTLRERGALVLQGAAYEADWAPPYGPWSEALRDLGRQVGRSTFLDLVANWSTALAPILPDRSLIAGLPDAPFDRAVLFQAVVDVLATAGRQAPIVVLLDDTQWADRDSLALLQWVARSVNHARVMVVVITRPIDSERSASLTSLIGTVRRTDPEAIIELRPFSLAEASQFIGARASGSAESIVARLFAASGGNALYLSELMRDLADSPGIAEEHAIPAGIRDLVRMRFSRVGPTARDLLLAFCVSRGGLPFPVVLTALALDEITALDALDEALGSFLLRVVDARLERYDLSHDIIKRAAVDSLSPSRVRLLHRRIAEAIEARPGEPSADDLADLAFHISHAHLDDDNRLIDLEIATARRAARQLAFEEAADHYRRAIVLLERQSASLPPGGPTDRLLESLVELGDARWAGGTRAEAKDAWLRAADLLRSGLSATPDQASARRLADIALRFRSTLVDPRAPDDRVIDLLAAAHALGSDRAIGARLLARWAQELTYSFSPAQQHQRRELTERALNDARASGDPRAIAAALDGSLHPHVSPADLANVITTSTEMATIARSIGDVELLMAALEWQIGALVQHGDIASAITALAEHTQLAERTRLPAYLYIDAGWRGTIATIHGRFGEALELAGRLGQIGEQIGDQNAPVYTVLQTMAVFRETGLPTEVVGHLDQIAQMMPDSVIFAIAAAICRESSDFDQTVLDRLSDAALTGLAAANAEVSCLCWAGELCARVGARERAAFIYDRLLPYSRIQAFIGRGLCFAGVVDRYLGLLASVLGRWDDADRHFALAEEVCRTTGALPQLTHVLLDRAALRRSRVAGDEDEQVGDAIFEARQIAARLGQTRLLADLDRVQH